MSVVSTSATATESAVEPLKTYKPRSLWASAWRRLIRGWNGRVGLFLVTVITLIAVVTPIVDPYDPRLDSEPAKSRRPPSLEHPFGNDFIGRDIFRRVMHGARYSLVVALSTILIGTVLSTAIGMVAGYFGGWVDMLIQRLAELMQAFPSIPLAIAIVAIAGPSLFNTVLAITIVSIPGGMRVARAMTLTLRTRDYVEAGRALGASHFHILWRHILPNLISYVIVGATLGVGGVILNAAALGFLGLGAQPPTPGRLRRLPPPSSRHSSSGAAVTA
ncbi:MAG: ABC transporter permease [Anaerolineae bacterium]|nr:ABC transporter permease [Thermoflexales bacterium]MDW8407894.1 ABC transporter permease [Anaerolineae bacterium]